MLKTLKNDNFMVVDLAEGVLVRTPILSTNFPALRAGFAGYPANPRWNAVKFHAWKTGRQLRSALAGGEMVVRSSDSMLVPANSEEGSTNAQPTTPVSKRPLGSQLMLAS